MKGYLSQIAARAGASPAGTPVNEANNLKPVILQWPARETADNSNPFEEINNPENSFDNTNTLYIDNPPGNMIFNKQTPLTHSLPDHDMTPPTPTPNQPDISYPINQPEKSRQQEPIVFKPGDKSLDSQEKIKVSPGDKPVVQEKQEKITGPFNKKVRDTLKPGTPDSLEPGTADSIEPAAAAPIQPETTYPGKPGSADPVKPGEIKKAAGPVSLTTGLIHQQVSIQSIEDKTTIKEQVIRETVKPGKETVIHQVVDTAAGTTDKEIKKTAGPVSLTTGLIHQQASIQSIEDKTTIKEQVIRETVKPGKETVVHQVVDAAAGSKEKGITAAAGSIDTPVSQLRPMSPHNPVQAIPLKKENREPKLKIGRLKVEVVTAQPVKTPPAVIRKVTQVKQSRPANAATGVFSKMRFGLGQI